MPALRVLALLLLGPAVAALAAAPKPTTQPAAVTESDSSFTLSNGYLTVVIDKRTGDLASLKTPATKTPGVELMGYVSGHHAGYWEQSPALAPRRETKITINTPERVEVSVKGYSDGQSILGPHPTAAGQDGGLIADLEIRYTLARGEHGVYTYAIFTHQDTYPAGTVGESRFGFKLSAKVFDWLSIDDQRNALMPTGADWDAGDDLNMKEARRLTTGIYKGRAEHKYDYSADQWKTPAFGWASTKENVGLYIINPSMEYLSSGPLHFELTGHLDDGDGGDPTLLDYWRGTHYGGSVLSFKANEYWTKVVGPIFIYVPTGGTPQQLFADARREATVQRNAWPYSWIAGVDYTPAAQRSTVRGRIHVDDPQSPMPAFSNLLVGLAYPDQPPPPMSAMPTLPPPPPVPPAPPTLPTQETQPDAGPPRDANGHILNRGTYVPPRRPNAGGGARGGGFRFTPQGITWENDAKHYEFWVNGNADGSFTIPNVRPGTYQLHAIADGIMGTFNSDPITVEPGKPLDLHQVTWHPVHYGKQVWEIGTANRSAKEFLMGNDHWHWGLYIQYSKLFPNDVTYTVGKSNPAKDWFIYQVPHVSGTDPTGKEQGRATPWTIHFNMPAGPQLTGTATLRFGLSDMSTRSVSIAVNDKPIQPLAGVGGGSTIGRDGVEGAWHEKDIAFDSSLFHPGDNTIVLTVPAGGASSGVCYDVVRLELAPDKPYVEPQTPATP